VDTFVSRTLEASGYIEKSYFFVPGGFALVTRLEQFNPDGTCKEHPPRWEVTPTKSGGFVVTKYITDLFKAKPGKYRVIVFVVTDQSFAQENRRVTSAEAREWLRDGANRLSLEIAIQPFSAEHACTALVYEFTRDENGPAAMLLSASSTPPGLPARIHLEKAKLWEKLTGK
jgi:hypothetical protein